MTIKLNDSNTADQVNGSPNDDKIFKKIFFQQLEQKNVTFSKYVDIINAYKNLLIEQCNIKNESQELKKDLKLLREQHSLCLEELKMLKPGSDSVTGTSTGGNSASGSAGAVGTSNTTNLSFSSSVYSGMTTVRVKELEEKVYNLQEELTSSFRQKAETAQQLLELNNQLKQLKNDNREKDTKIEDLNEQLKRANLSKAELETQCEKKQQAVEVLKVEIQTLKNETKSFHERVALLEKENKDVIERLVNEKQKQIEAMNQVHELYNTIMIQKKELADIQNRYRSNSKGGQTTTTTSSSSNDGDGGDISMDDDAKKKITPLVAAPTKIKAKQVISSQIHGVAINSECTLISTACSDKTLKLWKPSSLSTCTASLYGCVESAISTSFSADGQSVLGSSTDTVCRIWNLSNGRVRLTLSGHQKKIYAAEFSHDSQKVCTGSYDRTIKVFETQRGDSLRTILCSSSVNDLDIGKGNELIVSGHFDAHVRFFDLRSFKMVHDLDKAHTQQITSVKISSDNRFIVTSARDSVIKIFDVRNYKQLFTLADPEFKNAVNYNRACFSPCGTYVASGSGNGMVLVWDIQEGMVQSRLKGHQGPVVGCVWSSDGSTLVSASLDKSLILWQ